MRKLLYLALMCVGLALPSAAKAQNAVVTNLACARNPGYLTYTLGDDVIYCGWGRPSELLTSFNVYIDGVKVNTPRIESVNGQYTFNFVSPVGGNARNISVRVHGVNTIFGELAGTTVTVPPCTAATTPAVTNLTCSPSGTQINCTWTNPASTGWLTTWPTAYSAIKIDGVAVTSTSGRDGAVVPYVPARTSYSFSPGNNDSHTVSVQAQYPLVYNTCYAFSTPVTTTASLPLLSGPTFTEAVGGYDNGYFCDLTFTPLAGTTQVDIAQSGVVVVSRDPISVSTPVTKRVTGLSANAVLPFTLKMYGATWTTAFGAPVTCRIPPPAPSPTIVSSGVRTVTVSWPEVTGAYGYAVSLNGGAYSAPYTASPAVITGLADNTVYSAAVKAFNPGGYGPAGTTSSATTAPATPASMTVTSGYQQLTVSWAAVPGAAGYTVQRDGVFLRTTAGNVTSFVDTGLNNNTTYSYSVSANNASNQYGSYSTPVAGTTSGAAAGTVTALGQYRQATVTWEASAGATAYDVTRGGSLITACTNLTVLTCVDTGRPDNTSLTYAVIAKTNGVSATPSPSVTVSTAPAQTTNVAAVGSTGTYVVSWDLMAGAGGYKVESSSDNSTWVVRAGLVVHPATSYTSNNWPDCATTYWRVTTMGPAQGNNEVPSIASAVATAKTLPGAPTGPSAVNNGNATVTLSWSQPAGNSACTNMTTQYKRRSAGGTIVTSGAVTSPYEDTSATSAEEWHYSIYNISTDFGTSLNASEVSNVAAVPARMRARVGQ